MVDRVYTLKNLLEFSKSVEELKFVLNELGWDFDGTPILLSRTHLSNVLYRFLNSEISSKDIIDLANLIECREDIYFEEKYAEELSQLIYQLANPELEGEMDLNRCKKMNTALT